MKLLRQPGTVSIPFGPPRRSESGLSLVEMAVTLGVSSIVLIVIGLLSLYGLQSFVAMGSHAALDNANRLLADRLTRELRQADRVLAYAAEGDGRILVLTNSTRGYAVRYIWDAGARTVTCEQADEPPFVCLADCDTWEAWFFQGLPQDSATQPLLPATNGAGGLDLNAARVVTLTWKSSRPVLRTDRKTESAQTVQVVLRNAMSP